MASGYGARPLMWRGVAVDVVLYTSHTVGIYATPDAARDLARFGTIRPRDYPNNYYLIIDPRYDFEEVLVYLDRYGVTSGKKPGFDFTTTETAG